MFYDLKTKETQATHRVHQDYDIKFPSLGDKAIVFENGGWIFKLDLATEKIEKINVQNPRRSRHRPRRPTRREQDITDSGIAPDGKRAVFGARGDIFTVPAQHGPTRNLTKSPGVHERNPKWSPDGKPIAYISDASGEDEIWTRAARTAAAPATCAADHRAATPTSTPSTGRPTARRLLWADKKQRLQFVDVATKQVKLVAQAKVWEIREYVWSPDGRWIAYARPEAEGEQRVYLYSVDQDKTFAVTDGWYDSSRPGLQRRRQISVLHFQPRLQPDLQRTEWNHAYVDMQRVYLVPLAKDTPSPFDRRTTRSMPGRSADAAETRDKKDAPIKVDAGRLARTGCSGCPFTAADVSQSALRQRDRLLPSSAAARTAGSKCSCSIWPPQKETSLGTAAGFEIRANQKENAGRQQGGSRIRHHRPARRHRSPSANRSTCSGLEVRLDRHAEWKQIYNECWRQMRDYFYDPGMHGVDWTAIREKYAPLVEHVNHRADLTYIIGEMIGELNTGQPMSAAATCRPCGGFRSGLLGAKLRSDPATNIIKIIKILPDDNWDRTPAFAADRDRRGRARRAILSSPSTASRPTKSRNIYEALVNTVGKQVTLKVNKDPKPKGARRSRSSADRR